MGVLLAAKTTVNTQEKVGFVVYTNKFPTTPCLHYFTCDPYALAKFLEVHSSSPPIRYRFLSSSLFYQLQMHANNLLIRETCLAQLNVQHSLVLRYLENMLHKVNITHCSIFPHCRRLLVPLNTKPTPLLPLNTKPGSKVSRCIEITLIMLPPVLARSTKTFAMWKITRIGRGNTKKREHNSNPLQRHA